LCDFSKNQTIEVLTIFETFKDYSLTNGQQELLKNLNEFLEDKTSCFLLKGYAGTGKTFMMKGLTDFLKSTNRPFILAAPTGRAAKVISQRTKSKAYTIHKTIYSNKDLKEFKKEDIDGTETFKFYYDLKNNEDQTNTVYIIDEASMLSDVYSEGEFFRFGSGFLLEDFLKYINFDNNKHGKKVIFIGDSAQLPPVNMNFSPALNEQYLYEKYQIPVSGYELTEVIRQQKDSGILHNATKIRASLKSNIFNQIDIETNFADIEPVQHQDLLKTYLQACGNQIDDETIIIAYSNSSVKEYNDFVRSHFFPNQNTITEGDKIILVNNNYNYQIELLNGDFGLVKAVNKKNEIRITVLTKTDKKGMVHKVPIEIWYRDITIEFKDIDNIPHIINCKIIENLLYSEGRDVTSNQQKAMYLDFWVRNPKLNQIKQLLDAKAINYDKLNKLVIELSPNDLNADTLEKIKKFQKEYFKNPENKEIREISINILKEALQTDPYFNALRIKFGYAITCHKSQGGEWKRAFVNCKTAMGYFNASYFRWLYTALTRAKESLYTLNEPHFRVGSNLKPPKIENVTPRQDLIILKPEVLETELAFDFSQEQENLKAIFYAIFDLIKDDGITIGNIRHLLWCEDYTFSKGNEKGIFKIHYNKQNKISKIQKPNDSEFANSLTQNLQILVNKMIVIDSGVAKEVQTRVFDFAEPFLQEFYEFIFLKVSSEGISILEIKQSDWLQKYIFSKGNFIAELDFHYGSRKTFTKMTPQPKRSSSIELLNEIISLIGNFK
jgi:hypothetical protein